MVTKIPFGLLTPRRPGPAPLIFGPLARRRLSERRVVQERQVAFSGLGGLNPDQRPPLGLAV
ncbi:hypothetical protein LFADAHJC_LOCUS2498 [Methylorubrum extorquens]